MYFDVFFSATTWGLNVNLENYQFTINSFPVPLRGHNLDLPNTILTIFSCADNRDELSLNCLSYTGICISGFQGCNLVLPSCKQLCHANFWVLGFLGILKCPHKGIMYATLLFFYSSIICAAPGRLCWSLWKWDDASVFFKVHLFR